MLMSDKKTIKKCKKLESKIAACGYSCAGVKTEAPTVAPTEKPEPEGLLLD